MKDKMEIKQLISSYLDGECTPEEKELVEELILKSPEYQQYYKELSNLSSTLPAWPDEGISADLDIKLNSRISGAARKEGSPMRASNKKALIGGATALVAVAALVFTLQNYAQYSLQARVRDAAVHTPQTVEGKFKSAADDIGDQFKPQMNLPAATRQTVDVVAAGDKKAQLKDTEGQEARRSVLRTNEIITEKADSSIKSPKRELYGGRPEKQALPAAPAQYEPYYLESGYTAGNSLEKKHSAGAFQASSYDTTLMESDASGRARGLTEVHQPRTSPPVIYPEPPIDRDLPAPQEAFNTEEYASITENAFLAAADNPLSTFSIDVDTGSYSNIRRFFNSNQLPPADAVRIEEMVNYFSYDYPQPEGEDPFSITINAATCPWNPQNRLVRIGLKGKTMDAKTLPPSNLVFLIDVSGSMNDPNKLPLLKQGFKMMVNQLGDNERVALVVYAGAAGTVLDSTPGSNKQAIMDAIDRLSAGGSTAGGAGIRLAYEIARKNFIKEGNNRVILATDGDFNVGVSSTAEMTRLIEENRGSGIFLTVLGFGTGNLKDNRMEQIANKGNGNYYYIDTINEAKKVLVQELGSTIFTIAKDVKIQIEFNPGQVEAYRLIGYENRMLAKEDFNDDTKDAGELGAGHTVTALYEIVPKGEKAPAGQVDALKYQQTATVASDELMTVKLRYKVPDANTSRLITKSITSSDVTVELSGDFQFTAAVAEFGLLLRQSKFKAGATYERAISQAKQAKGEDKFGYRAEFIGLVEKAKALDVRPENSGEIQFK